MKRERVGIRSVTGRMGATCKIARLGWKLDPVEFHPLDFKGLPSLSRSPVVPSQWRLFLVTSARINGPMCHGVEGETKSRHRRHCAKIVMPRNGGRALQRYLAKSSGLLV